jgi:EAL domain-containing protein (putative c-di-GMP-specific phosphodiesterase class I)
VRKRCLRHADELTVDPQAGHSLVPEGRLETLDEVASELTTGLREAGAGGVLVIDASDLEEVERHMGARAHGQVLQRIAGRVRELVAPQLRPGDRVVLGELGRNEVVVVLLRDRHDGEFYAETLPQLAQHIEATLVEQAPRLVYPFARDSVQLPTGAVPLLYDPGVRPEVLLRRARDLALRDADLRARLAASRRRDAFLSLIFSEGVDVVFEPIERLENRKLLGFEALVRGPTGSEFATPYQLFRAAAECDALFELDCLCRRTALRAAGRLPAGAKLFLNCLPSVIHDPTFQAEELGGLLQAQGLAPQDVVFEISERESIANFAVFREVCDHYRELGFQIALDDVGVGYSSLEVVNELSPAFLKVDMSFVRGIDEDPSRREILKALTSVAWRIDASIIAEGIETEGEFATLRDLAVSYGQGYLIGRAADLKGNGEGEGRRPTPSR